MVQLERKLVDSDQGRLRDASAFLAASMIVLNKGAVLVEETVNFRRRNSTGAGRAVKCQIDSNINFPSFLTLGRRPGRALGSAAKLANRHKKFCGVIFS